MAHLDQDGHLATGSSARSDLLIQVQGSFPTNDAYGNSSNSVVLDVTYERDVLDKINFDGVIDDILSIRSSGFVHPELQ